MFDLYDGYFQPQIVIYTLEGCPACTQAKDYFRNRGVAFTVRDGAGLGEVPVVEVGGERTVGFDPRWIDAKLGR